mgnify:CR=1 FL=1
MFSLVIPLFNEEKSIHSLLQEIEIYLQEYKEYEIVLIDDCSTDNTKNILSKLNDKKIKIIQNKKNKGQSFSISEGVKNAFYETIVTLDGDGQNDPRDIAKLLNIFVNNVEIKLVGGLRIKRKDNLIKILSSKIANKIRSFILNDNCKDTGCSLKIFNKHIFIDFPYFDGIHRFLPALFSGYGHKTFFVEVNHRYRKYGYSKYGTMNRLFKGIKDIIIVRKIIKKYKNGG